MATMEERLAEYEELFASRYSDSDEKYQSHIAAQKRPAPVVPDWLNAGYDKRRDDRRRGGGDRGWDSRDRDRRDRYDSRDQRDNRDRGYGGGRRDYRDRGPRDNRNKHQIQYKSSGYYEMYY